MPISPSAPLLTTRRIVALLGAALGTSFAGSAVVAQEGQVREFDTIVVTASGFEQDITQAPASISVVTREELQQKSYTDLADALRDVEGIDVRGATGKTGNLNISIRGMPSEYTLVLIDGRRQNAAGNVTPNGFGDTSTGFIPPLSAIERIEVIRGPMSTLYGADAMGGVVNIITRKVSNEWGGSVGLETRIPQNSDEGTVNKTNFYLSGPIKTDLLGVAVRGSVMRRGESNLEFGDGSNVSARGPSPVEGQTYTIGAKFSLTPHKDHDFWLDLDRSRQTFENDKCQLGSLDGTDSDDCSVPDPTPAGIHGYKDKLRFNRDQIAIGHTSRFSFGTLESSVMRSTTETLGRTIPRAARIDANDPDIGSGRELKTVNNVFDTKLVAPVGENHLLTVGGQYWRATLTDGLVSDEFKQSMYSFFAEDEWMLRDDLTFTFGARYDHHDAFGGQVSPRGYLVWNPTDNWTLKGGVSRGFKTPNLNQLHAGVNNITRQGNDVGVGNPDLQPEVSTSSELGIHYDSHQGWSAGVTAFHNRIKDKISSTDCDVAWIPNCAAAAPYNPSRPVSYDINLDRATTQGLEFTGSVQLTDTWSLRANYTYTDTEVKREGQNIGDLGDTPKHMANATLRWEPTERYSLWLQAEYRGSSRRFDGKPSTYNADEREVYDAVGDLKGYTIFNLGGQYRVNKNVVLNATIYNLLDKDFLKCTTWTNSSGETQCSSPYIQTGRSTRGTIPSSGRAFWLSANITF